MSNSNQKTLNYDGLQHFYTKLESKFADSDTVHAHLSQINPHNITLEVSGDGNIISDISQSGNILSASKNNYGFSKKESNLVSEFCLKDMPIQAMSNIEPVQAGSGDPSP